jgi:predicted  nucleic acid-binding Zn-ribbon protein
MDAPGNNPEEYPLPPALGSYVLKTTFNDCWAELQSVKEAAREAEAKAARAMEAMAGLEDHNAYLLTRLQEQGHQLTEATHKAQTLRAQLTTLASCAKVFATLVDSKAQVYSKEDRELLNAFYDTLKQTYTPHLK